MVLPLTDQRGAPAQKNFKTGVNSRTLVQLLAGSWWKTLCLWFYLCIGGCASWEKRLLMRRRASQEYTLTSDLMRSHIPLCERGYLAMIQKHHDTLVSNRVYLYFNLLDFPAEACIHYLHLIQNYFGAILKNKPNKQKKLNYWDDWQSDLYMTIQKTTSSALEKLKDKDATASPSNTLNQLDILLF